VCVISADSKPPVTRVEALKRLAIVPAAALGVVAAMGPAQAADNKKQFKYQDTPGKGGAKCSGCRFFKAPHGCTIVTGTISPNGWCIAFAKK
jgi:hypothetical protein